MLNRIIAGILAIVALFALTACDNPKGQPCKEEGSHMYSSKHGNFVCRKGGMWNEPRWEKV